MIFQGDKYLPSVLFLMANCISLYEEIMYNLVNRYLSVRHLGCWQFSLQWTLDWGTFAHIVLNYLLAGKWWYWHLVFYYPVSHWKDCPNYFSINRTWECHSPHTITCTGGMFFFLLPSFTHGKRYLISIYVSLLLGFPGGAGGKELPTSAGDKRHRFDPWSGRSPGGGHSNPPPVF